MAVLVVRAYKPSGKFYSDEETEIQVNSYEDVFRLEKLIKANDPTIRCYSGLKDGFSSQFNYVVELRDSDFFMNFTLVTAGTNNSQSANVTESEYISFVMKNFLREIEKEQETIRNLHSEVVKLKEILKGQTELLLSYADFCQVPGNQFNPDLQYVELDGYMQYLSENGLLQPDVLAKYHYLQKRNYVNEPLEDLTNHKADDLLN